MRTDTQDLNDLYYFARVVEHRGFAAAGRAIGIPKSRLSRRVAALEHGLGTRLIQRSTRRFAVTELGETFYRHCRAMVSEAEAAREIIDRHRAEPQGTVRISCPVLIAQGPLSEIVSAFLRRYPLVRLRIDATNRRVDVINEGLDIAIRVRQLPLDDSELVVKILGSGDAALVASPAFLEHFGRPKQPEDLAHLDTLDMTRPGDDHQWTLTKDEDVRVVRLRPRLVTDEMMTLRQAALDGIGVVLLPTLPVVNDIEKGALEVVLPDWTLPTAVMHAVYPSRRGLMPAVRLFLDFLGESFANLSVEACKAGLQRPF